jgi:hypothetical protein
MVIVGRPWGAAPPMPRPAILARTIPLSRFSGLVVRTVGAAPGLVLGNAPATCVIAGAAAAQLGGPDNIPIGVARPMSADTADPDPPWPVIPADASVLAAGSTPDPDTDPSAPLSTAVPVVPAVLGMFAEFKPKLVVARVAV